MQQPFAFGMPLFDVDFPLILVFISFYYLSCLSWFVHHFLVFFVFSLNFVSFVVVVVVVVVTAQPS